MRSRTTERFRKLYRALPADIQRQVRAAYLLFMQDPRHRSLQYKRVSAVDPSLYSARVGAHYRAIGVLEDETITWIWVGSHEDYNTVLRQR